MISGTHKIVDRQIRRWNAERQAREKNASKIAIARPVITVSRELGSGGALVAKEVAIRLDYELIGRRIVQEIAKSANVRKELIETMDEHVSSEVKTWFNGMLSGEAFDEGDYHQHLLGALQAFTELGSVVLLGRGASFIFTDRPRIRVRVVASMEDRIERIMIRERCRRFEAVAAIDRSDSDRAEYIRRLFSRDWSDPLEYDLLINTDNVHISCAAAIVETAWLRKVTEFGVDIRQLNVS